VTFPSFEFRITAGKPLFDYHVEHAEAATDSDIAKGYRFIGSRVAIACQPGVDILRQ
jgi:hypothetical protein